MNVLRTGLALGCCAVLTACGTGHPAGGASGGGAGTPKGGWPQPINGRITESMCGLLTEADYARYRHTLLPLDSGNPIPGANGVDCLHMTGDDMTLTLHPTAESARLAYASALKEHKDRLAGDHKRSVLVLNPVGSADESWFDIWTIASSDGPDAEHELQVRRGSLIVDLVLGGIDKNAGDPKATLVGLATTLLQRIPDVGKTDTGTTKQVVYVVTGKGRAKEISYYDPVAAKTIKLTDVALPWHIEKPVASGGQNGAFTVTAQAKNLIGQFLGCSISLGGTVLDQKPPSSGFSICTGFSTPGQ